MNRILDCADLRITSPFGPRTSPTAGASSFHKGVDVVPTTGEIVDVIAHTGGIALPGEDASRGKYVILYCNGWVCMSYFHLSKIYVKYEENIMAGEPIGRMGSTGISTGAHLHFQIEDHGYYKDPTPYLNKDYMEVDKVTQEQYNRLADKRDAQIRASPPATDPDSVKARQWAQERGIFTGGDWRAPPTRNELAIALMRMEALLK